ncbi:MAG: hypothetical protein K6A14_08805 [Erysipelotrichaceae bacterium]|nr:hypothetical protein [Erysipelotrichaceae bacterium]
MKKAKAAWLIIWLVMVLMTIGCIFYGNLVQTDFGKVDVTVSSIDVDGGSITYKLYKPRTATAENPAPAVLLLHGYQNDKDTCDAYCIELSRRGFVVMAIDEYGHGSTTVSMIKRGYVNHVVKTNYGLDSEEEGTFKKIGGSKRYRLLMNFSNLSFFDERYSTDEEGNKITDSSMGGIAAYRYLADMEFVDPMRMGVSGHSMGTWASWSVAAGLCEARNSKGIDITPRATVLQAGELFTDDAYDYNLIYFNNVMLITAKYDEFNYFRDYQNTVSDKLLESSLRKDFLGISETGKWNTTYGDFSDGSARRCELLITNHRLATHSHQAVTSTVDWFANALEQPITLDSSSHTYMNKEWTQLAATLLAVFSLIPLAEFFLSTSLFANVADQVPDRPYRLKKGLGLMKGLLVTMLISGLTYPFMTQLGHALLPLPENIFRMTIGNGFIGWYGLLAIILLIMTVVSYFRSKKKGIPMDFMDLGFARNRNSHRFDWGLLFKSLLLAVLLFVAMYLVTFLCQTLFKLDLRFIWPFFRGFTVDRLIQFGVYLPLYILYFILANSRVIAQMPVKATTRKGSLAFLANWIIVALGMIGGVLLIVLLEYIPFFANLGPGADLLFGSTFGGPFMSLMIVLVPQVLVFSVLATWFYRRTGNVFTGGILIAMLACWIITGGSAML